MTDKGPEGVTRPAKGLVNTDDRIAYSRFAVATVLVWSDDAGSAFASTSVVQSP